MPLIGYIMLIASHIGQHKRFEIEIIFLYLTCHSKNDSSRPRPEINYNAGRKPRKVATYELSFIDGDSYRRRLRLATGARCRRQNIAFSDYSAGLMMPEYSMQDIIAAGFLISKAGLHASLSKNGSQPRAAATSATKIKHFHASRCGQRQPFLAPTYISFLKKRALISRVRSHYLCRPSLHRTTRFI